MFPVEYLYAGRAQLLAQFVGFRKVLYRACALTLFKRAGTRSRDGPFWPCVVKGEPEIDVTGLKRHQKSMSELYEDLLLHGAGASDANIEVEPAAAYPELVGRTFVEAGRLLDGAALLGLVGAAGAAEPLPRA